MSPDQNLLTTSSLTSETNLRSASSAAEMASLRSSLSDLQKSVQKLRMFLDATTLKSTNTTTTQAAPLCATSPSASSTTSASAPTPHEASFQLLSLPEVFQSLSSKSATSSCPPPTDELQKLQRDALRTMRSVWAVATWNQRISLQSRLEQFRADHNMLEDNSDLGLDWAIVLFTQSSNTIASSKATYIKSLAALYRRQLRDLPLCSLFATALRATSTIPMHQAAPATPDLVSRAILRASENPRLQLTLFLMFKAASRFDEVARLTKEQFILNTPEEIIIEWLNKTKTTRLDPWRASAWVVIKHTQPMTLYNNIINSLETETELMEDWSTSNFTTWLSQDTKTAHLSAQSFKRGALTLLAQEVVRNNLDISLIPRLAKHKVELDLLPATTFRYLADRITLARMMKTQEATILISCYPTTPPPMASPPASSSSKTTPRPGNWLRLINRTPAQRPVPVTTQIQQQQELVELGETIHQRIRERRKQRALAEAKRESEKQ